MRFEFATATRIIFGNGTLKEAAPATASLGRNALIVIGKSARRVTPLIDGLSAAGVRTTLFHVEGEPTVSLALSGAEQARKAGCDVVIGMGGGSVLDAGKAIAALITNAGDIYDYLEVVGKGLPLPNPSAPCVAIPTTSGTGSEVTRNAVLTAKENRVKVSLRSPHMLPRLAVVDPELTRSVPPAITAATGLDALTQVIEPFLSNAPNPLVDSLCREAIKRGGRSLRRAFDHGDDPDAREDMAIVSLFGGLALANAKLGAVHGLAGPIGGMFPAAHGAVCARLLPFVMERNLMALRERMPDSPVLSRFTEVARILTGREQADAQDGIQWLKELVMVLQIPALSSSDITTADFQDIVNRSKKSSSMKGNPIGLTDQELTDILRQAV